MPFFPMHNMYMAPMGHVWTSGEGGLLVRRGTLLRRAQLGHVSLKQIRRWSVDMGALLPAWLAEGLAGVMLVYAASCCHLVLQSGGLRR